eukprot:1005860-Amphidinium_carterae.1
MATSTGDARRVWSQAFVSGQAKLVAADRLLPLVHLLPHHLLDAGQLGSSTVVEVLIVALLWAEDAAPQDILERVLVCVPLGAVAEGSQTETVGLPLYGHGGVEGQEREMIGDCNGCFLLLVPSVLSHLMDQVPAMPPRHVITFSEHACGGTPCSAEAFSQWSMTDGTNGLEKKNMLYLDLDSDVLRAWVAGQALENDVFLSAGEEEWVEGDLQRSSQLLELTSCSARSRVGFSAANSTQQSSWWRECCQERAAEAWHTKCGRSQPFGIGVPAAGCGPLLVEQQAQGFAQRMRDAKAKATAKSQDVGELAAAMLQGIQQLGERLGRLEDAHAQGLPGVASVLPPPAPPPAVAHTSASARPPIRPGLASARPIAPACVGAGPQFGANVGVQYTRGLLSPSPREGAGVRSYQVALRQAQAHLLPQSGAGARGNVPLMGADSPPTRGRERGSGRVLRELLEQQHQQQSTGGGESSTTQLLVQAHEVARTIEKHPDLFTEMFNLQLIKALGADVSGTPLSAQQYAASRISFKRLETQERAFHMLAALHAHCMRGERSLMLAKTCQFMKSIEQSVQQNGAWRAGWLLTGLADPRPPPGGFQLGLAHSAELGLAASFMKEWKMLEEAAKKESEAGTAAAMTTSAREEEEEVPNGLLRRQHRQVAGALSAA